MGIIKRHAKRGSCVIATTVFALTGLWTVPVAAQSELVIEQITVTARKKEETLQDVPLSITVLGSQMLEDARIQNLADVAAFTPGLSFFNPIGEFLPVPVIRGMAPTDIFGEANAAIFLDGVYVAGREGLNFSFLEVERIEVVKGPQTALYGRNAFSGAINFITKKPTDEFDAKVDVMAGNDGRTLGQFNVRGPLVGDTLTGRLGLAYDNFDGNYDNTTSGTDVGGYEYATFTGGLNWRPTDSLNLLWQVYYSDDEIDPNATSSLTLNCENDIFAGGAPGFTGDPPDPDPAATYPNDRPLAFCGDVPTLSETNAELGVGDEVINKAPGTMGEEREITRSSLNIDWDLDFGTFTFLTGYSKTEQNSITDFSRNLGNQHPFESCDLPLPNSFFGLGTCTESDVQIWRTGIINIELGEETEEWSQEIRFTSAQDRRVRYSLGGTYYTTDVEALGGWPEATTLQPTDITIGNFVAFTRPDNLFPIGDGIYGSALTQNGVDAARREGAANNIQEGRDGWRLFGLVAWDIVDTLTLELQLGYTDEEQDFVRTVATVMDPMNPMAGNLDIDTISGGDSWDYVDGGLSLTYSGLNNWNIYGSIATSTKPGTLETITGDVITDTGPPLVILPNQTHINTVDVEELIAYEIGAKGTVWGGRAVMEAAVFLNDWTDVVLREQIDRDPTTGLPYDEPKARKANAGDATVWGVEFAADILFNERWSSRLALGYQEAEWDEGTLDSLWEYPSFGSRSCFDTSDPTDSSPPPIVPTPPECQNNLAGQTMQRQPDWQGSLSVTYQRPVFGDWEWFTRADGTYEGSWFPQDDNLATIPEHIFVNLSLGFKSDRWTITAWVNNLFEEDDPIATFRDIAFNNTDDYSQTRPLVGRESSQIFGLRYTVAHPRLTTYGLQVQARFGASSM